MPLAQTLTGARCKLFIDSKPVGLFASVSFDVQYDAQDIYTIGKENAQEIVYTGMNTIDVRVSGFRVMDHGPYQDISVPKLQDLLSHNDIQLQIVDRRGTQAGPGPGSQNVVTIHQVRPLGYSFETSARGVASLSVVFRGITLNDDTDAAPQADTINAASYI